MRLNRGRREVTPGEAKLWQEAMKGVRPFPTSVAAAETGPPPDSPPAPPDAIRRSAPLPALQPGRGTDLDKRTFQRLKKGEMAIDGVLDLHGMTQDAAHAALLGFLEKAAGAGQRCLLVITGKGGQAGTGILRAQLPRWLNEPWPRSLILATTAARPQHGGEGAFYVLLRRRR